MDVADALGDLDDAEVLAVGCERPDAAGAGDPDVAALVALHPVDEAAGGDVPVADVLRRTAARSRSTRRRCTSKTRISAFGVSLT